MTSPRDQDNSMLSLLKKLKDKDKTIADLEKRLDDVKLTSLEDATTSNNVKDDFQTLLTLIEKKEENKVFKNLDSKENSVNSIIFQEQFKRFGLSYTKLKVDDQYLYGKLNLKRPEPETFDVVKTDDIVNHVLNRADYTWVLVTMFLPSLGLERKDIKIIILPAADKSRSALKGEKAEGGLSGSEDYPACHIISARLNPKFLDTTEGFEKEKVKRKIIYDIFYDIFKIVEFMPRMVNLGIDINLDTATINLIKDDKLSFEKYQKYIRKKSVIEKIIKYERNWYKNIKLKKEKTIIGIQFMKQSQVSKLEKIKQLELNSYEEEKINLIKLTEILTTEKNEAKKLKTDIAKDEASYRIKAAEINLDSCEKRLNGLKVSLEHFSKILQLEQYKAAIENLFNIEFLNSDLKFVKKQNEFEFINKKFKQVFYTCFYDACRKEFTQTDLIDLIKWSRIFNDYRYV